MYYVYIFQNLYKPCRVRKRKGVLPTNELEQVNATLSEYDQRMLMHVSNNKTDVKKDEGLDFLVCFLHNPKILIYKLITLIYNHYHINYNYCV